MQELRDQTTLRDPGMLTHSEKQMIALRKQLLSKNYGNKISSPKNSDYIKNSILLLSGEKSMSPMKKTVQ